MMLDLIKIRRELHKIPELGFKEFKTTKYISRILQNMKGLKLHFFDFPGILVEYSHSKGAYKLFRADMDALPIKETTDCSFMSVHNGNMHACGHDIHMTVLLGLIDRVVTTRLEENLLFLFQPAEEGMGGAEKILETGILDEYKISQAFALHVSGNLPVGTIATKPGIFFANTQEVEIQIKGRSAHVAFPEKGKNALAGGAEFYLELQKQLGQQFSTDDSVICEFGKMTAGNVMNAIADESVLEGTMRAFSIENMKNIKKLIEQISKQVADKYDLEFSSIYKSFYKQVDNNSHLYDLVKSVTAKQGYKFMEAEAVFTGEDFGYFTDKYDGLLFWLGVDQGNSHDLHSAQFLPSEEAIPIGIDVFYNLI